MEEQLRAGFRILKEIEKCYETGEIVQANQLLEEHYDTYKGNFNWRMMKALLLDCQGKTGAARQLLEQDYYLHRLHYEANYNLGVFCYEEKDYEQALFYFVNAMYCKEDETRPEVHNSMMGFIEQMCSQEPTLIPLIGKESERAELAHKRIQDLFPVKTLAMVEQEEAEQQKTGRVLVDDRGQKANTGNGSEQLTGYRRGETYIGKAFPVEEGYAYYSGIYDNSYEERDGIEASFSGFLPQYKTETIYGEKTKQQVFSFEQPETVTVPILVYRDYQPVRAVAQEEYQFTHMIARRFYYYTFREVTELVLNSDSDMVVGETIVWRKKKSQPNVIINLFVDGLSQQFIEEYGMERLMPNTARFFKEGTICTQGFSNGEWTYPSLASYFTGLRTRNHGLYHSSYYNPNLWQFPTFTERLKEEGYMCSRMDGDWRSTPPTGYAKGMTRQIYQQAVRAMKVDDNVEEVIEQLAAFPKTPQFIWLGIPDLHDAPDEWETRLSTQTTADIHDREIQRSAQTSVQKQYDTVKINRYITQLQRVDRVLEQLYHYLGTHYSKEDCLVTFMSDHGQGFTRENARFFMDEHRTRVPMMFWGSGIPKGICRELMESTDFFPVVLHAAGISYDGKEGHVPVYFGGKEKRNFVLTESIHENRLYQAAVYDEKYAFFLLSKELMKEDESIDLSGYEVHLMERGGTEVTEERPELTRQYRDMVLRHIEEYITAI